MMKSILLLAFVLGCALAVQNPIIAQMRASFAEHKRGVAAKPVPCVRVTCAKRGAVCPGNDYADDDFEPPLACEDCFPISNTTLTCPEILAGLTCLGSRNCLSSYAQLLATCRFSSCPSCPAAPVFPRCQDGFCGGPTVPETLYGVCNSLSLPGSSCDTAQDLCIASTCFEGKCAYLERSVGDKCSRNQECDSGVCTSGVCVGKAVGVSCQSSNQCDSGLWCSGADSGTGTCAPFLALGATCDPDGNDDMCGFLNTCDVLTSKCIRALQGAVGADCDDDTFLPCRAGLFCTRAGKCAAYPSTLANCSQTTGCTEGDCVCNESTGQPVCTLFSLKDTKCQSVFEKLSKCTAGRCNDFGMEAHSCPSRFCSSSVLDDAKECAFSLQGVGSFFKSCNSFYESSGSFLSVSFFLVLIALALMF